MPRVFIRVEPVASARNMSARIAQVSKGVHTLGDRLSDPGYCCIMTEIVVARRSAKRPRRQPSLLDVRQDAQLFKAGQIGWSDPLQMRDRMATPVTRGRFTGKSDGVEDLIRAPVANTVNVDAESILFGQLDYFVHLLLCEVAVK